MKNPAKLLAAVAAGLVLTTGAYAQEAAPASNLGPAVGSSRPAAGGRFGGLGATAAALTVGIMVATFSIASNAWEDDPEAPEDPVTPPPPPPHEAHHPATSPHH